MSQPLLYRCDRIAGRILDITAVIMVLLALVLIAVGVLEHHDIRLDAHAWWPTAVLIYKYLWRVCGIIAVLCIVARLCLSPFVKSEEEEDFEKKVEYILQQESQKQKAIPAISSDYSPLRDLTQEQEKKVKKVLKKLPPNAKKPKAINLALIARYLTALEKLGHADLSDKPSLRIWVAQVTDKEVPTPSQFNEAIPSTNRTAVAAAKEEWQKLLIEAEVVG